MRHDHKQLACSPFSFDDSSTVVADCKGRTGLRYDGKTCPGHASCTGTCFPMNIYIFFSVIYKCCSHIFFFYFKYFSNAVPLITVQFIFCKYISWPLFFFKGILWGYLALQYYNKIFPFYFSNFSSMLN